LNARTESAEDRISSAISLFVEGSELLVYMELDIEKQPITFVQCCAGDPIELAGWLLRGYLTP
jgi:hypothetical protein